MTSSKFNKCQVALQTAHVTPIAADAMTIQVPWRGTYEDKRQVHIADYDAGTWTPTQIVAEVSTEVAMTFEGSAFYELLPVLLNSGLADVAPTGSYIHTYTISPAAVGAPMPLTALVGAVGLDIGGTGPATRLSGLYLKTLTLSGNINDKAVMLKAELFGTSYDNNSGAGYAFDTVGLPATMELVNALKGVIKYKDAGAAGSVFSGMTDLNCTVLDWELTLDTGIEPLWCLSQTTAVTTFAGVKHTQPSLEFKPIIRTNATTYAAIKGKELTRTFQEVQLSLAGATVADSLVVNMTGLWDVVPTAHDDQDGEIVMKPTFICRTPHTQTSDMHFGAFIVTSTHNWT